MEKGKVLRLDLIAQLTAVAILLLFIILSQTQQLPLYWAAIVLIILVVWQFFFGIYIATAFKMFYRGVPPGALLILVTVAILFAVAAFDLGLLFSFCLFPLILLSNLVLAMVDWFRWKARHTHPSAEAILDTDDIFG